MQATNDEYMNSWILSIVLTKGPITPLDLQREVRSTMGSDVFGNGDLFRACMWSMINSKVLFMDWEEKVMFRRKKSRYG